MPDDLLVTVRKASAGYDKCGCGSSLCGACRPLDELKKIATIRSLLDRYTTAEADLTALRERYAAAVEAAYREAIYAMYGGPDDADSAWLASEARRGVTP